jgi:hypothetical protein
MLRFIQENMRQAAACQYLSRKPLYDIFLTLHIALPFFLSCYFL